ncbi:MAG: WG repeat-containing protein [Bacteroidales bacterium]|nr:WG repeat-containing protein [Bacteroidales bacterium]
MKQHLVACLTLIASLTLGTLHLSAQEVYPCYHPCRAEDGLWGYVDNEGEWAIPPVYTCLLYETNGGMYPVSNGGKWGFVGMSGEPLTEIAYDAAVCEIDYTKGNYPAYFAALRRKGKWAFINVQGIFVTDFVYDEILILGGKYVIRQKDKAGKMRTGYLDKNGHEVWNK